MTNGTNGEISQSLSQFVEILFYFHSKIIESMARNFCSRNNNIMMLYNTDDYR